MRSALSPTEQPSTAGTTAIAAWRGDIAALAATWDALGDESHPGYAFRAWSWNAAWWKTFSANGELLVLAAHQAGRIVGLLPLYSRPAPLGGRRLAFLGEGIVGSDYLGLVAARRQAPELARAFADHLAGERFDELDLDGMLPDDPLLQALTTRLDGGQGRTTPRYVCPHVQIAGAGSFDAYLKTLANGAGQQFRRRLRWLEKRPGFSIDRLTAPDDVDRGLDALFELHRRRWAVEGGSQAIDSPAVEAFHRAAARNFAERGQAHLYLLQVEGAPRAALYGFRHGNRFAFYQAGYDPDWRQRSVGTVLLGHILERCFGEGLDEFDFLRGTESYKLTWANGQRETVRLRAHDGSLRARLHDAGRDYYWRLRERSKRALSPATLEWARRTRAKVFSHER